MPRSKTTAANHRNLRDHAVGYRVHHFGASADNATPFRILAHHEAADIVEEDQWDEMLVAIENEACGFFRGFGIDHAAELDALFARSRRENIYVLFF